ncbi:hypothetical protein [Saccharopolyspora taberi]|uniref:Uncharacterized protein n=1 Tax=Saccharopolyspora taberi TaxID=60895 RepID=A0ABN3VFT9_9PSEU
MSEQAPQPDYAQKTIAVMDALERWEQDPAAERDVAEAIGAVFSDGGMLVLLGWAQLLASVADDGEEAELFDFVRDEQSFRRDLAAELVAAAERDGAVQHGVLGRILDLDDRRLWVLTVYLAHAVRRHVFAPCGGARHCLAVGAGCEEAAGLAGRPELAPAVVPCAVTLAACSAGSYDTARRSSGVGFARAGFSPMVTLLWLVAQGAARGTARAYVADEHGVPDRAIGVDPGADSQQRVHALVLRLLRTPVQEAKTSGVFEEVGALDWDDKMTVLWSLSTAVGSLFTRALHQRPADG